MRQLAVDVRWAATAASILLALLAGVMLELVVADHSRADLVWIVGVAALLAGSVGSVVMIGVRDADLLWETRKDAAIALGDAEIAARRADACSSDDLRSRELLQGLQVATVDAMRDPVLTDRLARGPREEHDLLSLLDQIDRHLASDPGAVRRAGTAVSATAVGHGKRTPNARNP